MHGAAAAGGGARHRQLRARAGMVTGEAPGAVLEHEQVGGEQLAGRQNFTAHHQGTAAVQYGFAFAAAYLERAGFGENGGPALDDRRPPDQRRPAGWMQQTGASRAQMRSIAAMSPPAKAV